MAKIGRVYRLMLGQFWVAWFSSVWGILLWNIPPISNPHPLDRRMKSRYDQTLPMRLDEASGLARVVRLMAGPDSVSRVLPAMCHSRQSLAGQEARAGRPIHKIY